MSRFTPPFHHFLLVRSIRNRISCNVTRSFPLASCSRNVEVPASYLHTSQQCFRKMKKDLSSEPTKFTSSAANIPIMPSIPDSRNPYQPLIVSVSFFIFLIYFLLLREENDLDEGLNYGLFDRVPQLEEPHLMQAIPRMRDAGIDTREAEKRLEELRGKRLDREAKEKRD